MNKLLVAAAAASLALAGCAAQTDHAGNDGRTGTAPVPTEDGMRVEPIDNTASDYSDTEGQTYTEDGLREKANPATHDQMEPEHTMVIMDGQRRVVGPNGRILTSAEQREYMRTRNK